MSQTVEILLPEGRLVGGHPMNQNVVTDDRTKQPKLGQDGQPRKEAFIAIAIPKQGAPDWKQSPWGSLIAQAGQAAWPSGEFNAPTFAWKVEDGDSQVPNKRGKKNCDREGYPGHWIIKGSTGIPIKCYHAGYYDPTQQIQDANAIKPGDFCRVLVNVRGNGSTDSPGVYMNPALFELSRAGDLIVLDSGTSAAEAFGGQGGTVQQPAGAVPGGAPGGIPGAQPAAAAPPLTGIQPAHDFVQGAAAGTPGAPPPPAGAAPGQPPAQPMPQVVKYQTANGPFTYEQLQAAGWSDAAIQACPVTQ